MEKPLSQKISRFLKIVNFVLLIPTSLVEFIFLFYGLFALFGGESFFFFYVLVISIVYAFGTLLLYGYHKHSRNEISNTNSIYLWVSTIFFNGVPLCIMFCNWANSEFTIEDQTAALWFYNIFGAYQIIVLLAIVALIDDVRRNFD